MIDKIGKKYVLVSKSPYGMFDHNTEQTPKIIEIEVIGCIEKPNKLDVDYIARGSDGYMYKNIESHEAWERHCTDADFNRLTEKEKDDLVKDYIWFDVVGYQCPAKPKFANQFAVKIKWCEKHQQLYYDWHHCFYCKRMPDFKRRVIMNTKEHSWLGWY